MRILIYIFLLAAVGCANKTQRDKSTAERIELVPEPDKGVNCSAMDLVKLKDKELQDEFFKQLDSIKKVQYSNYTQDTGNSVDITPNLLRQFLENINADSLQMNGVYESHFFFNIAPPQYVDSKKCKDIISIQYFIDCGFRMVIDNVYLVEKEGCIGGSQVVYGFKIIDGKIVDFGRQEAG